MKRILTYTTFCLLLVFASCSEEQLEVYHGDNYAAGNNNNTVNNYNKSRRKLLQQRNDGYFGEYAGWPAVLQSAAENVPHVTQKRRYPHAQ